MSSTTTTATELGDSGYSAASLRLSLASSAKEEEEEESPRKQPAVKMPTATSSLQDSGICDDLGKLCIGAKSKKVPPPPKGVERNSAALTSVDMLRDDAWQEYYEQDEDGDVQLHLAIASGYVEVVHALVRMAPHPDYLSIQNNATYAPLHIAVLQNQPAIVRRLVVAGARLDVRDREGNTPLHLAARRGNLECGEALLNPISVQEVQQAELPPTLYTQLPVDIIDLKNHTGEHCLHLATMGGHTHFLRFLCWNNADLNAVDGRAGRSALHFAVGMGNMSVIQCLVEPRPSGCGINMNQVDWYGRTAYQLALLNGSNEIATFLARRLVGSDATPFDEGSLAGNSSEDELCEPDDWSGKKASILLNSSA